LIALLNKQATISDKALHCYVNVNGVTSNVINGFCFYLPCSINRSFNLRD